MAGTGGTTSYSPISLLTGTTLLPPKPATTTAPKPAATVTPKPATTNTLSQMMGSSGTASSSSTKKPATNTLSEMMGSSGSAGSASAKKPTTNTLSQMMGSSGTATTTKAPTADQKKAINSLAGLDKAAQNVPTQTKDAIGKAYMAALAASVKSGGAGAVPDPKGLTSAEIDKYRSQFFSNLYSNQPVQQIVEPMDMAQATQAYDINKRLDPKILDYLNSGFPRPAPAPQAPQFINTVPMGMGLGYAQTPVGGMPGVTQGVRPEGPVGGLPAVSAYGPGVIPGPMPQQQYVAPGNQVIAQPRPPAAPAGGGYTTDMLNSKGIARYLLQDMMGNQQPAAPAIVAQQQGGSFDPMSFLVGQAQGADLPANYGQTPTTRAVPTMNYTGEPAMSDVLLAQLATRVGLGSDKASLTLANPFYQAGRVGATNPTIGNALTTPSAYDTSGFAPDLMYYYNVDRTPAPRPVPVQTFAPSPMEDALIASGVLPGRSTNYVRPEYSPNTAFAPAAPTAAPTAAPVPAPRPVNVAEVTIPLDEMMRRTREEAGLGAGKVPTDPAEFAALVNAGLEGLGAYDPATGRMVIADPNGPVAQAAKQELLNPKPFDFVGETARDVFAPYIAAATERRIPYPATDVPPDLTAPGNISAQGIGAERGISAALPSAASPVSPQGIGAERGIATSTPYAAQQKAAVDALIAGGQAAAAVPTPANRQGQYGALDDLLSGRLAEQWTAEGEAQRAKRLAEGVDPNNFYDNLMWSAGLYRPQPGAPSKAPAPSPASTVLPPDNSLRQPQAVTQDVLAGLGVRPADPFVRQYGNVPVTLTDDTSGVQKVWVPNNATQMDESVGTLDASGAFTSGRAPVKTATVAEAPANTPDIVSPGPESVPDVDSLGPEGRLTAVDPETGRVYSEPRAPGQYDLGYVKNSAGVSGVQYIPQAGQIVAPSGYIYEKNAEGGYDRVGKVPGYTDAELYKAANKGAFRDPNNIVVGGTEVAPNGGVRQSGLVKWAREQKAKYEAEVAKKTAEAKAKGETYNPVPFTDYLSAAASVATGSIPGMIASAVKLGGPAVIDWLASQPLSQKSKSSYDPYDYAGSAEKASGSSSSKSKNKGKDKDDADDTGGTDGTGSTDGTTLPPPGSAGYQFAALFPEYANVVFPSSTYRPGIDPEWDYFRKFADGGFVNQPRMVVGPGGPKDDKIPARIDNREEARLSNGEFVITAEAVRGLGGGDPQRGAMELMKLNEMFSGKPNGSKLNVEKVR